MRREILTVHYRNSETETFHISYYNAEGSCLELGLAGSSTQKRIGIPFDRIDDYIYEQKED